MGRIIKNFNITISAKTTPADEYTDVCKLSIGECDGDNSYISMYNVDSVRVHLER